MFLPWTSFIDPWCQVTLLYLRRASFFLTLLSCYNSELLNKFKFLVNSLGATVDPTCTVTSAYFSLILAGVAGGVCMGVSVRTSKIRTTLLYLAAEHDTCCQQEESPASCNRLGGL